jgi:pantetheine-phosphate adenylyltransferase
MRSAVYAGSFDPFTKGHEAIARIGAGMFDKLTVLLAANPEKKGRFTVAERFAFVQETLRDLPNVEVINIHGHFVTQWAASHGCQYMIRGLRGPADLEQERVIEKVNATIRPDIQTVYLPAPLDVENVSSSLVMGLVGNIGWRSVVKGFVPQVVYKALVERHLRAYFERLVISEGCDFLTRSKVIDKLFGQLVVAYSEPHRHYHTLEHIVDVLEQLDLYTDTEDISRMHAKALRFAAFYHDFMNTGDSLDEPGSAEVARDLDDVIGFSDLVARLVLATHKAGANIEKDFKDEPDLMELAKLFVDADMSILGRKPDEYNRYVAATRKEYARYNDEQWNAGRSHFLKTVIDRKRVFLTHRFYAPYEAQALYNMQGELNDLAAQRTHDAA